MNRLDAPDFARRLKRRMEECRMSRRELADAVGVSSIAIGNYLVRGHVPRGDVLCEMADTLSTTPRELIGPVERRAA